MNKPAINAETLKFIGGAIVVGAAVMIMFPAFLSLAAGMLRIFLVLVIAGGGCLAFARLTRAAGKRIGSNDVNRQITTNDPQPESEKKEAEA